MSLETCYGPELNVFEPSSGHANRSYLLPILSYKKLDWILKINFKVKTFCLEYGESSSISVQLISSFWMFLQP